MLLPKKISKWQKKTQKLVFSTDVHPVFDIYWYSLAKKLSEDFAPVDKGTDKDTKIVHEGVTLPLLRRSIRPKKEPRCHLRQRRIQKREKAKTAG